MLVYDIQNEEVVRRDLIVFIIIAILAQNKLK